MFLLCCCFLCGFNLIFRLFLKKICRINSKVDKLKNERTRNFLLFNCLSLFTCCFGLQRFYLNTPFDLCCGCGLLCLSPYIALPAILIFQCGFCFLLMLAIFFSIILLIIEAIIIFLIILIVDAALKFIIFPDMDINLLLFSLIPLICPLSSLICPILVLPCYPISLCPFSFPCFGWCASFLDLFCGPCCLSFRSCCLKRCVARKVNNKLKKATKKIVPINNNNPSTGPTPRSIQNSKPTPKNLVSPKFRKVNLRVE